MYRYRRYGIKEIENSDITKTEIKRFRKEAERTKPQSKPLADKPLHELIDAGIERSKKENRRMYEEIDLDF